MHDPIHIISGWQTTPWELIGYLGILMFGGRWLIQIYASRQANEPVTPRPFWYLTIAGSATLMTYFTIGQPDTVGLIANIFPAFIGTYNLYLDFKKG